MPAVSSRERPVKTESHALGLCEATLYGRPETFEAASERARLSGALRLSAMCDYNLANLYGLQLRGRDGLTTAQRAIGTAAKLGAPLLEALGWVTAGQSEALVAGRAKARLAGDRARTATPGNAEVDGLASGMCDGWGELIAGDLDSSAAHETMGQLIDAITAGRTQSSEQAEGHLERVRASLERHSEMASSVEGTWHLIWTVAAVPALEHCWGEPAADLERAEQWFRDHGFDGTARWCASLLHGAGVGPRQRGKTRVDLPAALAGYGVTAREFDVLELLAERLSNREIAERLVVSPSTVKTHVERLLAKTGRNNRIELAELVAALDD